MVDYICRQKSDVLLGGRSNDEAEVHMRVFMALRHQQLYGLDVSNN